MEDIRIALAQGGDVRGIQELLYATWLDTYPNDELGITREDIEERFKDRFTPEALAKRVARIENPEPGVTTLIAKLGDKVVGICTVTALNDRNEQHAFYVLPEFQGKGIGTRLWNEAQKYIDPRLDTYVDVVEYNTKAIKFYEGLGYRDTGERPVDERFRLQSGTAFTEMRMCRKSPRETS